MKERVGDGKLTIISITVSGINDGMPTTKLVNTASDRDQTYSALPFSLTLKLIYDL